MKSGSHSHNHEPYITYEPITICGYAAVRLIVWCNNGRGKWNNEDAIEDVFEGLSFIVAELAREAGYCLPFNGPERYLQS